jgi:FtsP/CotA-like multicopper oxidase with cupredoxin domain
MNMGPNSFGMHPVHLHGHSFYVLRMAFGQFDPITGLLKGQNPDISCVANTSCSLASWQAGQPPINTYRPPRKDTLLVPPYGYAIVRFVADNPGW